MIMKNKNGQEHVMNFEHKKNDRFYLSLLWYPLGDSNPCYRRERAAS